MRFLRIAARVAAEPAALYVESLGTVGEFAVWTVDGEFVRDNIDIDFVAGGNHSRYPNSIPEGEIWLEATNDPHDMGATALHEAIESTVMRDFGLEYEEAHDLSDKFELPFRQEMESGEVEIDSNAQAISLADQKFRALKEEYESTEE